MQEKFSHLNLKELWRAGSTTISFQKTIICLQHNELQHQRPYRSCAEGVSGAGTGADLDDWIIFVKLRDGEAVGGVYCMTDDDGWFEIFGVDMKDGAFDPELFGALLRQALNTAKELGGKHMTFFCEKQEREIVGQLGFQSVGEYVCYKMHLI